MGAALIRITSSLLYSLQYVVTHFSIILLLFCGILGFLQANYRYSTILIDSLTYA